MSTPSNEPSREDVRAVPDPGELERSAREQLHERELRCGRRYFPSLDREEGSRFMMTAAVLDTAGEPVLDGALPADRVYRLTVSSAMWRPAAVARVRLDRTEGSVHVRTFARQHSAEWLGPLEAIKDRPLSAAQVEAIAAVMDDLDFSRLPRATSARVLDGTTWTLEANRAGTYHVLLRHAPDRRVDEEFLRACRQLLTLAELRVP